MFICDAVLVESFPTLDNWRGETLARVLIDKICMMSTHPNPICGGL
ncbi:hypothetical protein AGR8A_pTi10073 [Agrobacterium fabrum str. J-07]|nr:hypothetical protein AGR8A_pTi10073 [Agrobacterium fabrum str. J-07]